MQSHRHDKWLGPNVFKCKHTCAPGIKVPRILSCSPGPTAYKYSWLVTLSAFSHGKPLLLDIYSSVHAQVTCPERIPVTPVQSKQCPAAKWDWLGRNRITAAYHRLRPHLPATPLLDTALFLGTKVTSPGSRQGSYCSKDWSQSGSLGLPWFS